MEGVKTLNRLSCFLHVIVETNRIYEGSRMFLEIGRRRKRKRERKRDRNRVINRVIVSLIFFFYSLCVPSISIALSSISMMARWYLSYPCVVDTHRARACTCRLSRSIHFPRMYYRVEGLKFRGTGSNINLLSSWRKEGGGIEESVRTTKQPFQHSRFSGGCFDETEVRSRRGYKTASVRE